MAKEKMSRGKIVGIIILVVLITLVISAYLFYYKPQQDKNNEINAYKKALYLSSLCQYKCPLTNQILNNVTMLLPEPSCTQNCTKALKSEFGNGDGFSNKDLENDNLFGDIVYDVNRCKNENSVNGTINNLLYFNCIIVGMEALPQNYTYLN